MAMNLGHKVPVSIVGGTGYSGEELLKILLRHPAVRIDRIFGQVNAGKKIGDVFPAFTGVLNTTIEEYHHTATESSELIFLALPSGHAMGIVPELLEAKKKVIDLSGDYRLRDAHIYKQYYGQAHTSHALTHDAHYGIPELDGAPGHGRALV